MKPIVSVCVPVYKVEDYIEKCINSVLAQSLKNFELIVVNDATPDNSMEVVLALAEKDSRIKIYNNKENMGLMWSRREGYMRAQGDYIVFLDSDDTLPLDSLQLLYSAISETEADIVCGQIAYITNCEVSVDKYPNKLLYGTDRISVLKSVLNWEVTHNLCGKIYSRKLLQSYNYTTYKGIVNAEDALLFYQLLANVKKVETISHIVYNYYLYGTSSTNVELDAKALRGIFLWQKHRYDLITAYYPKLTKELYVSMTEYLTSLTPSLSSRMVINDYMRNYGVPFKISFFNIIRYIPPRKVFKCLLSYYLNRQVKKIRYHRLKR